MFRQEIKNITASIFKRTKLIVYIYSIKHIFSKVDIKNVKIKYIIYSTVYTGIYIYILRSVFI